MKNKLMIAAGVACAVAAGANSIGGLVLACLGHDTLGVPVCILRRDAVRPDGDAAGPGA